MHSPQTSIHAYLTQDHARLEQLLARATAEPGRISLPEMTAFRAGLLRHIGLEEKLLLPALKRLRGGEPHPLARRLRLDHGAIASLLVPTPTPAIVAALRAVLEPHDRAEEAPGGLYESCGALPDGEAEALLERMRATREPPLSPFNDGPAVFRQIEHTMRAAGIDHPPPTGPGSRTS